MKKALLYIIYVLIAVSCSNAQTHNEITVGAEQLDIYLPKLQGKTIAVVVNQTSTIGETHLVDTLFSSGVKMKHIFAPEHGFRGKADAGETIQNGKDINTGLPIISLYGKNKKPNAEQLQGLDLVIFDIQDVGVRFYTYISTMHYIMEACAEHNIPLMILDRPNPNGHYIDGPVLEKEFKSFVGMHPIPVVHGLTVAELAQMINGEGWLKNNLQCKLDIIKTKGWHHQMPYDLPTKPSPNLPNATAINLYPSLCFFEPTQISVGRGTYMPFQIIGSPDSEGNFSFTPISIDGMSKYPKHENKLCIGLDLRQSPPLDSINLEYLVTFYQDRKNKETFFTNPKFFNLLAGNSTLQQQIKEGKSAKEIRSSWKADLEAYTKMRKKYLIYD